MTAAGEDPTAPMGTADAQTQPSPEPPPPEAPWTTPDETPAGRRGRGCLVAVVVVAALAVVGFFGLVFLGGQIMNVMRGTMQFGTGGTECSVTGQATTFPVSSPLHVVAFLERDTTEGEVLTLVVTDPAGATTSRDEDPVEAGATCVYLDVAPGGLTPGRYELEYRSGDEVLSKGGFDVTP